MAPELFADALRLLGGSRDSLAGIPRYRRPWSTYPVSRITTVRQWLSTLAADTHSTVLIMWPAERVAVDLPI